LPLSPESRKVAGFLQPLKERKLEATAKRNVSVLFSSLPFSLLPRNRLRGAEVLGAFPPQIHLAKQKPKREPSLLAGWGAGPLSGSPPVRASTWGSPQCACTHRPPQNCLSASLTHILPLQMTNLTEREECGLVF